MRPPLNEFNQVVLQCWNFAGGWNVEGLQKAAEFYAVEDFQMLLMLAMKIRDTFAERAAT